MPCDQARVRRRCYLRRLLRVAGPACARGHRVGPRTNPDTRIGPLQNRQQSSRRRSTISEVARRDGRIIAGGTVREQAGYFINPTVVRDIDDTSALVTEEQFSPILPIVLAKAEQMSEEAVPRP
ncbi:aldehyde dehydrogenase family protein [Cupriavidus basilensis]